MNAEQADLYRRIQKFSVDKPGSDFPFSRRLAQENGWTIEYTQRVVDEYKKFAFLAVAAGHPVAPSDQVDQVWHLHLVYTHSYWDEFCLKVLQKSLHHDPAQGGQSEYEKFNDWYRKTLASYDAFFGYKPPEDIWPAADVRFDRNVHFVRVNTQQCWILPKLRLDQRIVGALPLISVLFFTVCELFIPELLRPIEIWNPLSFRGPEFLKFYLMVASIGAAVAFYWRWRLWQPLPLKSFPQLNAYETAYLSNGGYRAVNTAIVSLVQRGHLTLLPETQRLTLADDLPEDCHPLEKAIKQAVEIDGRVGWVRLSALPAVEPIPKSLNNLGLLLNDDQAEMFRNYPALVACAVLPLGLTKLLLGLSLQRPVGYLIMLCVLIGWLGYFFLREKPLYRSRLGNRMLNSLRSNRHSALPTGTLTIMLSLNTISSTLVKRNRGIAISFGDYH